MAKLIVEAHKRDLTVHFHAIGDGAVKCALDALEIANQTVDITKDRHAFTHLKCVRDEDIARMGEFGIVAAANPYWHAKNSDGKVDYDLMVKLFGDEVAQNEYPLKSYINAGSVTTFASDFPVSDIDPMKAFGLSVMRAMPGEDANDVLNPKERLTVNEALQSLTLNGAYQLGLENVNGSLEIGKEANLVLLSDDVTKIAPEKIFDVKIMRTIIDGETVFEAK